MNYEQLVMWTHGMLEYRDIDNLTLEEAKIMLQGIKDHVALKFEKITPKAPVAVDVKPKFDLNEILKRQVIKPVKVEPLIPNPYLEIPFPYRPDYLEPKKFWLGPDTKVMC